MALGVAESMLYNKENEGNYKSGHVELNIQVLWFCDSK